MANNPYVNKVQKADGTTILDISDSTALASDVAQGKYFYLATGEKVQGTATGGSGDGYVWQDAQGYVHLSDEPGTQITVEPLSVTQNGTYTATTGHAYSPVTVNVSGGGGLVYEAGTYTPAEDVARPTINFTNTHTVPPMFVMMSDSTGTYDSTTRTNYEFTFMDWYRLAGAYYPSESTSQTSAYYVRYRSTNATAMSGTQGVLANNSDDPTAASYSYPRYWVDTTHFNPYTLNDSNYWRAGRTYKWIAVWAPTT